MTIPEIQQFRDLMAEKAAAKALVLEAVGQRRAAEAKGQDSSAAVAVIDENGIDGGSEGKKFAAMQALADKVVAEHPELFANMEPYAVSGATFPAIRDGQAANLTGLEMLVSMKTAFKQLGLADEATLVTMFELARFERQQIGVAAQPQLRTPRAGGRT